MKTLLRDIKSASAHIVNRQLGLAGSVWQRESFDRIIRSDESLAEKVGYILNNPVRKGLVKSWEEYPWIWVAWQGFVACTKKP